MNVALNIQTIIFGLLACLVLFLAFLIILVVFVGVLRIAVLSVFEFDFIKWWQNREKKVKPKKQKEDVDLPKVDTQMGLYKFKVKGDNDENI